MQPVVWLVVGLSLSALVLFNFYLLLACLGNPLFLVKARMQAYSPALPVGTQHHYRSSWHALSTIWKAEKWRGLVRGIDAAALRTGMGSSVRIRFLLVLVVSFDVDLIAGSTALL